MNEIITNSIAYNAECEHWIERLSRLSPESFNAAKEFLDVLTNKNREEER